MKFKKNEVVVYVEGGGDSDQLRSELRQAFAGFFDKTELQTCKPRVIACGSREHAFRDFRLAISQGANALLLVDSEAPIHPQHDGQSQFLPWAHLEVQDNWDKPARAADEDCHLMVQCMESWFLADWDKVSQFFGQGFKANAKPAQAIEKVSKEAIYDALDKATRDCKTKAKYGKGTHSFKLLALISPKLVLDASPWASRFIGELVKRKKMDGFKH